MRVIKYYINLYIAFVKNTLTRETDYRANFIGDLIDSLANFIVSILFFDTLYLNVDTIASWGKYETLLLVGTAQLLTSLLYTFFMNNLPRVQKYVLHGDLDYIMLKPCDSQFYISFRYFYFGGIANAVPAVLLILYSLNRLSISISLGKGCVFIFYVICGLGISYALWMIVMTCSIYFLKVSELHELFLSTLKFIEYPGSIYKGILRIIFTFVIPFLAIANIPVEYLSGQLSFENSIYVVVIAILFVVLSKVFWNKSLKWYQSASS